MFVLFLSPNIIFYGKKVFGCYCKWHIDTIQTKRQNIIRFVLNIFYDFDFLIKYMICSSSSSSYFHFVWRPFELCNRRHALHSLNGSHFKFDIIKIHVMRINNNNVSSMEIFLLVMVAKLIQINVSQSVLLIACSINITNFYHALCMLARNRTKA